jgi:hypothetical protein
MATSVTSMIAFIGGVNPVCTDSCRVHATISSLDAATGKPGKVRLERITASASA